jgi:hypothetical protein
MSSNTTGVAPGSTVVVSQTSPLFSVLFGASFGFFFSFFGFDCIWDEISLGKWMLGHM